MRCTKKSFKNLNVICNIISRKQSIIFFLIVDADIIRWVFKGRSLLAFTFVVHNPFTSEGAINDFFNNEQVRHLFFWFQVVCWKQAEFEIADTKTSRVCFRGGTSSFKRENAIYAHNSKFANDFCWSESFFYTWMTMLFFQADLGYVMPHKIRLKKFFDCFFHKPNHESEIFRIDIKYTPLGQGEPQCILRTS